MFSANCNNLCFSWCYYMIILNPIFHWIFFFIPIVIVIFKRIQRMVPFEKRESCLLFTRSYQFMFYSLKRRWQHITIWLHVNIHSFNAFLLIQQPPCALYRKLCHSGRFAAGLKLITGYSNFMLCMNSRRVAWIQHLFMLSGLLLLLKRKTNRMQTFPSQHQHKVQM